MKPVVAAALSLTSALAVVPGWDAASSQGTSYATDGTFTFTFWYYPANFDPYNGTAFDLTYLAYDSLVNMRPDGEYVSGLAEDWTVDADGATFTLRDDVTCSDGTALTASQVAAAINYVVDPANQSNIFQANLPVPVTATGDDAAGTVDVALAEPFGFLLFSIGRLPIVCANGMDDREMLATESAGTGPFVIADHDEQSWTLTRRDDYVWGPDGATTAEPGTPATVVIRAVEQESTAANMLVSGDVDAARIVGPDWQRLDGQGFTRVDLPEPGPQVWFNQGEGRATADVRVRQALVHALDLEELAKVGGETTTPATGLLAYEQDPCPGDTVTGHVPEHDLAAAAALLDEAGWTADDGGIRSKDGQPLRLNLAPYALTSIHNQPVAELMAAQWEAIGVEVELTTITAVTLGEVLYETSNWDVFVNPLLFQTPDQIAPNVSEPVVPVVWNFAFIDNDEYNSLAAEAQALTPPEACSYWHQAEQALFENVDVVPVLDQTAFWFLRGAEAEFMFSGQNGPIPTSIRVLE